MEQREQEEVQEARGAIYGFFSALFRKPLSPGELKRVLSEEGVSALCSLFHECPEGRGLENLRQAYDGTKWESEDLLIEYESLFRVPGRQYVHPYESVYSCSGSPGHPNDCPFMDASITREVLKFYKTEGLEPSQGFDGHADHLATELEFMAQLCRRSANFLGLGKINEAKIYCGKQGAFFKDHLNRWAGACLEKIREEAGHPFYRVFAAFLDSFLKNERHLLETVGHETV